MFLKFLYYISLVLLISCKREYTCECVITSDMPGNSKTISLSNTPKLSEKEAIAHCDRGNRTNSVLDPVSGNVYTTEADCNLK